MMPITREAVVERRQVPMRWSAVFAGAVVSLVTWFLLQALGSGVAMMRLSPGDVTNLSGLGFLTGGWWFVFAALVATFCGGLVAGWLETTASTRVMGAAYGLVSWGVSGAIGMVLVIGLALSLASGVVRIGAAALQATGNIVGAAAGELQPGAAASALGIDLDTVTTAINQRLQAAGKPAITPAQLEDTVRAVALRGLREGKLDRQVLVAAIARNTALTPADARDVVEQTGNQIDQMWAELQQAGTSAQQAVARTVNNVGTDVLWMGITLILTLITATIGGAVGSGIRARMGRGDDDGGGGARTFTPPETAAATATEMSSS